MTLRERILEAVATRALSAQEVAREVKATKGAANSHLVALFRAGDIHRARRIGRTGLAEFHYSATQAALDALESPGGAFIVRVTDTDLATRVRDHCDASSQHYTEFCEDALRLAMGLEAGDE